MRGHDLGRATSGCPLGGMQGADPGPRGLCLRTSPTLGGTQQHDLFQIQDGRPCLGPRFLSWIPSPKDGPFPPREGPRAGSDLMLLTVSAADFASMLKPWILVLAQYQGEVVVAAAQRAGLGRGMHHHPLGPYNRCLKLIHAYATCII